MPKIPLAAHPIAMIYIDMAEINNAVISPKKVPKPCDTKKTKHYSANIYVKKSLSFEVLLTVTKRVEAHDSKHGSQV